MSFKNADIANGDGANEKGVEDGNRHGMMTSVDSEDEPCVHEVDVDSNSNDMMTSVDSGVGDENDDMAISLDNEDKVEDCANAELKQEMSVR